MDTETSAHSNMQDQVPLKRNMQLTDNHGNAQLSVDGTSFILSNYLLFL